MFRHNEDRIWINDTRIPLSEFMIDEPAYTLPDGTIGREYDGKVDRLYSEKKEWRKEGPNSELDKYIEKLPTYLKNMEARTNSEIDALFASDLGAARAKKKKDIKKEAGRRFREYQDSDLEISDSDLATYKTNLIAQNTTIAKEIDSLTNIQAIREYKYVNWPDEPSK